MAEVLPDEVVRVITRLVGPNNTLYANTFYAQNREVTGIDDADAIDDMETWIETLFGEIEPSLDSSVIEQEAQVDLVEVVGVYNPDPEVNTAKVSVVRPMGFFNGFFTGGNAGEEMPGVVTATIIPQTNVARVRARKSFSGWAEGQITEGLFTNTTLSRLAACGARWVMGPTGAGAPRDWGGGTLSLRLGIFAGFTGTFTVTNIPGTMVTRKIGRGA